MLNPQVLKRSMALAVPERGRVPVSLTREDRVALFRYNEHLGSGTFKVLDTPAGTLLEVGPFIGLFALPSFTLRVLPKTDVHPFNVLYMLWRTSARQWPLPDTNQDFQHSDLQEVLAAIFLEELEQQVWRGLLRQQQVVQEQSSAVRGRLRVPEYLRRTDLTRVPVEYTDLTASHPVNRLFGLVLERLARLVVSPQSRQRLAQLRVVLLDARVEPLQAVPRNRQSYVLNRLYRRYEPALTLAWLLLDGWGNVPDQGNWSSPSFTFNMDALFEGFLERVIVEDLLPGTAYQGVAQGSGLTHRFLFSSNTQLLKPDLLITENGVVKLVIDFKNKRPSSQFGREDLYQMYAYARHLECGQVLLLYPGEFLTNHINATRGEPLRVTAGSVDLSSSWQEKLPQLHQQLRQHLVQQGLNL